MERKENSIYTVSDDAITLIIMFTDYVTLVSVSALNEGYFNV
jgi:hypothetical protein